MANLEEAIEGEVLGVVTKERELETALAELEQELASDPKFKNFLKKQTELKEAQTKSAEVWKNIETQMIEHDIKSIKGDWGWITIAERQGWEVDEAELPAKFFKKVVDTKRITDTYRLEGKAPKGAKPYTTKYLTKGLK